MKKKNLLILIAIFIVSLIVVGIYKYTNKDNYSNHLDKAEAALTKITALIENKTPTSSFIQSVYAENEKLDEVSIIENTNIAVDEISMAQNILNNLNDKKKQADAQNETDETKDHAKKVFDTASDSENPNNENDMSADRETTDTQSNNDDNGNNNENGAEAAAQATPEEDDEENYDEAEAEATKRYQPLLDWDGTTPLPLEDLEEYDALQKKQAENPTIDPKLMEAAIKKLLEQQARE